MWFATTRGLRNLYGDGLTLEEVLPSDGLERAFCCIKTLNQSTWAGGNGLYEASGDRYYPVPLGQLDLVVNALASTDGEDLWIASETRSASPGGSLFYRRDHRSNVEPFPLISGGVEDQTKVTSLEYLADVDSLSVSTAQRAYLLRSGAIVARMPFANVAKVVRVNSQHYFLRPEHNSTVLEAYPTPLRSRLEGVLDIARVEDEFWFSVGGQVKTIPPQTRGGMKLPRDLLPNLDYRNLDAVKYIRETANYHFLISRDFVLFRDREGPPDAFRLLAFKDESFDLKFTLENDGNFWFAGRSGVYKFLHDVGIKVTFNTLDGGTTKVLEKDPLRVTHVEYEGSPPNLPPGDFRLLIETNRSNFEKRKYNFSEFMPLRDLKVRIGPTSDVIYVGIIDHFGNYSEQISFIRRPPQEPDGDSPFHSWLLQQLYQLTGLIGLGTLVAAIAFLISVLPLPRPRWRLFLYFTALLASIPTPLVVVLSPQYEWVRRRFISIYKEAKCASLNTGHCPVKIPAIVDEFLAKRILVLQPDKLSTEEAEWTARYLLCKPSRVPPELFPLVVPVTHFKSDENFGDTVMNLLARDIKYSSKRFCRALLRTHLFAFIVLIDAKDIGTEIEEAIDGFFERHEVVDGDRKNYLLKAPVRMPSQDEPAAPGVTADGSA